MDYIIDSHQDIAYNALTFHRDIRLSAEETSIKERGTQIPLWNQGEASVGWPNYQAGNVALVFATLWTPPWKYRGGEWDLQAHQNTRQGSLCYRQQLDYYRRLCDESPHMFRLVTSRRDLEQVLTPYEENLDQSEKSVGFVLLMEGAEGLLSPDELEEFAALGVRQVGPVWAGTRYFSGSKEEHPFDREGRHILDVMSSLKIALDVSHMSERSILTALENFDGVVFASHANARRPLRNTCGERHLTDQTIHALIERDAVIGVIPYNLFLHPDWTFNTPYVSVTLDHLVEQIDYYCQLAGDARHTGIGSDLDGGFGYPNIPAPMRSISDLQKLKPLLLKKGYTEADVADIFGRNWKKHLETILPE